ncbi:hypothetical protein KO525_00060 [Psychrosphaera sp. B3R10]|uniref:hypothetical protein n=1 Tax=unclassified Psychrosphaera TaxID=2641570 RepID=UPI001C091445|nr:MULTISPECIES: hypothetical protein [unclassified Psychrosphaera]MBU2880339.1 hypothetical protein [Psychrosphaera sp. I2R16]MBU2987778.1 hypothetical protein [Psychrosphaera sp. B3R10]
MKKIIKIILAVSFVTAVLTGCVMTPQTDALGNSFVGFGEHQIVTEEEAKKLPRGERLTRISIDMQNIGFKKVKVSNLMDSVTESILSIFENQYELLSRYTLIVDDHKDVTSFIYANEGKSSEELAEEVRRFDMMAETEDQKIGPKLQRYRTANDEIQKQNTILAGELVKQTVRLASFFQENSEELLGADALTMLLNAGKISEAYNLAEIRIHMASIANDFIDDEKAVLEITKKIQEILDEKL